MVVLQAPACALLTGEFCAGGFLACRPGTQEASTEFTTYSNAVGGVTPAPWVASLGTLSTALGGLAAYQNGNNPLSGEHDG